MRGHASAQQHRVTVGCCNREGSLFIVGAEPRGMSATARETLGWLWPLVGTAYLVYLALQPPPVRWVGVICLVVVVPLLAGWVLGRVVGVGPWADG